MEETKKKLIQIWESIPKQKKIKKKLSFSQYRLWRECPHLHFLISISKSIPYPDNDYTAYGFPLHLTMEKMMLEYSLGEKSNPQENYDFFLQKYEENIKDIIEKGMDENELNYDNVIKFAQAAKEHIRNIYDYLEKKFGKFEIISVEEAFEEPLDTEFDTEHYTFLFRGMMDLVIRTEDGIYHIIDWKTSNNGWSDYRKNTTLFLDQLMFYKYFLHKKYQISLNKISSHFIILESTDYVIDQLTIDNNVNNMFSILDHLKNMIFNAFVSRNYIQTGMCGTTCECQKYYFSLTN